MICRRKRQKGSCNGHFDKLPVCFLRLPGILFYFSCTALYFPLCSPGRCFGVACLFSNSARRKRLHAIFFGNDSNIDLCRRDGAAVQSPGYLLFGGGNASTGSRRRYLLYHGVCPERQHTNLFGIAFPYDWNCRSAGFGDYAGLVSGTSLAENTVVTQGSPVIIARLINLPCCRRSSDSSFSIRFHFLPSIQKPRCFYFRRLCRQ